MAQLTHVREIQPPDAIRDTLADLRTAHTPTEQAQFEIFASNLGLMIEKNSQGMYHDPRTYGAYLGWRGHKTHAAALADSPTVEEVIPFMGVDPEPFLAPCHGA